MLQLEAIEPAPETLRAPRGLVLENGSAEAAGAVVLSFPLDMRRPQTVRLTPTEWDVLRDLMQGLSNQEIAQRRGVAVRTVANQLGALFKKLRVHSRLDAAIAASHWTPPSDGTPAH